MNAFAVLYDEYLTHLIDMKVAGARGVNKANLLRLSCSNGQFMSTLSLTGPSIWCDLFYFTEKEQKTETKKQKMNKKPRSDSPREDMRNRIVTTM